MDLVWFAITPHVPVLSPACKLLPSKESPSVLGDGASPIGQEASSASKRKALLSFPFPGRKEDLHVCPGKASWLMQGLQRERHAQNKSKPKQRHKTPNSIM